MTIDTIKDPLIDFVVRIISHKFYQSSRLNSVPCIAGDLAFKLVENDHTYDLAKLWYIISMKTLEQLENQKGLIVNLVQC